jgi:multidrug efflux pump
MFDMEDQIMQAKNNSRTYYFEKAPVGKAILNFSVPMIITMLVTQVYNIVDTFYIGLLGDFNLIAAIALSLPVPTIFMAMGNIFGIGGGTFISRLLGAKEYQKAKNTSSFSFYSLIVIGVILTVLGFLFMNPLLKILGTSTDTIEPTRNYVSIMLIAGIPTALSFALSAIIRSEGGAKISMLGNLIGTGTNFILDPIFIFVFGWGLTGAAIATALSNVLVVTIYIVYILRKSTVLSLIISDFKVNKEIVSETLKIGFPAFLQSIVMLFSTLATNNLARTFGDIYIAVFGIIFKLIMLPKMMTIGLCQGIQPLVGYNYSAKNMPRVRAVIKRTLLIGCATGGCIFIVAFLGSNAILSVFSADKNVVALGGPLFKIATVSFLVCGIQSLAINVFQAIGKAIPAFTMSITQGILYIPFLVALSSLFGIVGFAWAQPLVEITTATIGGVLYLALRKKMMNDHSN